MRKKVTWREQRTYSVTVGCDPEFELIQDGTVKVAGASFGDRFISSSAFGNVGIDGSGAQIEIRPRPGNAEKVVENIKELLFQFGTHHGDYRLAASSDRFPCGGHIHIGVSPKPEPLFFNRVVTILNDFIGYPTRELNGRSRKGGSYGRIGDNYRPSHGLEYRTPPGGVFRDPELSKIVLQLAQNLTQKLADSNEISYETPISKKDLVEVGGISEEEAVFYLEECKRTPPAHTECLLAAWKIPTINCQFVDDWNNVIRTKIIDIIKDADIKIPIILYGLRGSRGDSFTFPVTTSELLPHPNPKPTWGGKLVFGFSKQFRENGETPIRTLQILEAFKTILTTK